MNMCAVAEPAPSGEDIEIRVRCQHGLHRVVLRPDGCLVLCDHDDIREIVDAEEAAAIAGHEGMFRCGQIMCAWRAGKVRELPKALRKAREQAAAKRYGRYDYTTPEQTLADRLEERTIVIATRALAQCTYRRAKGRWAGGRHSVAVGVGLPACEGKSTKVWSNNGKWSGYDSSLDVVVPPDWLRIARRGIAVVGGVFVVNISTEPLIKDGPIGVLAVRQSRGFSVRLAAATVSRDGDGTWKLCWLPD
jgi:hypothetical protein